jgi:hypothetical protein
MTPTTPDNSTRTNHQRKEWLPEAFPRLDPLDREAGIRPPGSHGESAP